MMKYIAAGAFVLASTFAFDGFSVDRAEAKYCDKRVGFAKHDLKYKARKLAEAKAGKAYLAKKYGSRWKTRKRTSSATKNKNGIWFYKVSYFVCSE